MGTDVAGILWVWKLELWESRGDEICFCGNTAGCFRNLADDKNSGASIKIPGKLSHEMSYMAAKYVVDSWSSATVFRLSATAYRAVTEHNINGNGEDGKKLVRGWQGWIRKYTGVDGRKGCRNVWGWD